MFFVIQFANGVRPGRFVVELSEGFHVVDEDQQLAFLLQTEARDTKVVVERLFVVGSQDLGHSRLFDVLLKFDNERWERVSCFSEAKCLFGYFFRRVGFVDACLDDAGRGWLFGGSFTFFVRLGGREEAACVC